MCSIRCQSRLSLLRKENKWGEPHDHPSFFPGESFRLQKEGEPTQSIVVLLSWGNRDQSTQLLKWLEFVGQATGKKGDAQRRSSKNLHRSPLIPSAKYSTVCVQNETPWGWAKRNYWGRNNHQDAENWAIKACMGLIDIWVPTSYREKTLVNTPDIW